MSAARVRVKPELLSWACGRSGRDINYLRGKFKKLPEWESGERLPTLKQLEDFAAATYTPVGYLFLDEPPAETLPVPDFRTLGGERGGSPGANLLSTVYAMQRRSRWLREIRIEDGAEPLDFVGAADLNDSPADVARKMRRRAGLKDGWADEARGWEDAVGKLRRAIEESGVMAVINGIVGNDTHRKLDVREFRGFALCDEYAPLIFVNGADSKSAAMFTLAHELAHVWLKREGVSGFEGVIASGGEVEKFCDAAAAEFLVPERELAGYRPQAGRKDGFCRSVARRFKVSPVVAARRALDLKLIGRRDFFEFYRRYAAEESYKKKKSGGGDFFANQSARVGESFAAEVIRAANEGRVSFRDAYQMTGLYGKTFDRYGRHLGFDFI